jgi:hypothetical protein
MTLGFSVPGVFGTWALLIFENILVKGWPNQTGRYFKEVDLARIVSKPCVLICMHDPMKSLLREPKFTNN